MNEITEKPLVSIIVITYNSSEYILETLESVKNQTYSNIELIISDDCSKDETMQICQQWTAKNKTRFLNTEIITTPINYGIPANCNRGIHRTKGEWIKLIAGDDALLENCITDNIDFVLKNTEVKFLQSLADVYNDTFESENFLGSEPRPKRSINFNDDVQTQYKTLLKLNFVITPSMFLNKKTLTNLENFDEEFYLFEDLPLWLKATRNGIKIYFLNKSTVKYRIHKNSVSKKSKPHMDSNFARLRLKFQKKYISENVGLYERIKIETKFKLLIFLDDKGFNNNSKLNSYLYKMVNLLNYI